MYNKYNIQITGKIKRFFLFLSTCSFSFFSQKKTENIERNNLGQLETCIAGNRVPKLLPQSAFLLVIGQL